MSIELIDTEERIIEGFESFFDCQPGPPRAFFELPQRVGDSVRVTYVVYAITGQDLSDMEQWFFARVIDPLRYKAGTGSFLYWRNSERVSVSVRSVDGAKTQYVIRTRLAVFDRDLHEIRIHDAIKPEGVTTPEI